MEKIKLLFSVFLVVWVTQGAVAQQRTVGGTVTDTMGDPLPGVNILIKGTTRGTLTDLDGTYSISVETGDILVFSYLGMSKIEMSVGSANVMDLTMESEMDLNEVVVVAYGSQTKKSLVGSVTSLDSESLDKQQLTSVTNAIQGTVSGVNVITSSGQPGTNPTIRIRGIGSINASSDPLIIVDGVPFNGNINSISADQIASMNVLKDASSSALYGSRAANGVILITTKSGAYNTGTKVTFSAITGVSSPAVDYHKVLGTEEYLGYVWEARRNTNQYINGQTPELAGQNAASGIIADLGYNPYDVAQPIDENGNIVAGANLLWDTDWERALFNTTASRNEYSLGVSGGGEKSKYNLSANYLDQEGPVRTSDFRRITARLNLESKLDDWLTVGLNSSLSNSKSNVPVQSGGGFDSPLGWVYGISSVFPIYRRDPSGQLILDDLGNTQFDYGNNGNQLNGARPLRPNFNAVGSLFDNINTLNTTNSIINGFATVRFMEGLSMKTNISFEHFLSDSYDYDNLYGGTAIQTGGRVGQARNITTTLNVNNNLSYSKSFGEHTIHANAIFETYQYKFDGMNAAGTGFLPGVLVLNGATVPANVGGYIGEERITSYLGRLGYNYKDKYFLEGSFRRDGSTKFSTDTRWGNFYSIGGSWIISDEAFLFNSEAVSLLKLRASYGELGNNSGFGLFPYRQGYITGVNELDNTGVLLGGVTDPFLTWETTAILDIGLDFGLFGNRLEGTVGYFNKESIDLIYDKPIPGSTGSTSITTNIGSLRNYGLEVSLTGRIVERGKFSWRAGANFATIANEITELTQESVITGNKRYEVGRSVFDFYMQEWAGVDPEDGYGMWYKDVLDAEGNPTGEKETTKNYSEASRNYQGSSLPRVTGGFNSDFNWGAFDLSVLFNFSLGGKIYDSSYAGLSSGFINAGNQGGAFMASRWQQPGDVTDVPLFLATQNDFTSTSTRFLFDNDYLRFKAVTFGYNLPQSLTERISIERLRLFVRGENLLTWQSHKGIDPEQNLGGGTDNRSSIMKTFSFGLNINL